MSKILVQRIGDSVYLAVPVAAQVDRDGSASEYVEILLERHTAKLLAGLLASAAGATMADGLSAAVEQILAEADG